MGPFIHTHRHSTKRDRFDGTISNRANKKNEHFAIYVLRSLDSPFDACYVWIVFAVVGSVERCCESFRTSSQQYSRVYNLFSNFVFAQQWGHIGLPRLRQQPTTNNQLVFFFSFLRGSSIKRTIQRVQSRLLPFCLLSTPWKGAAGEIARMLNNHRDIFNWIILFLISFNFSLDSP